uniref:Putative type II secretion system protein n=1 Tax=Sulfobacillus thermotolerans TaxID=338644 RepID=G5CIZ5_9FIRM|nr:type II secretion system F family protein [Sulfobacillus thermotolerans]AEP14272.1 putative type II secretion system protein [Sulfobacillus thermotolerans]
MWRIDVAGGLLAIVSGCVGWGLWLLFSYPQAAPLAPVESRPARTPRYGIQQGWLALTGLPLTPRDVRHLGWLSGAAATVAITLATNNVLVGTAFGLVGLLLPEAAIRYGARKQWQRLDWAAYGAAHMLQAKLQGGMPVLEAFRALVPETSEPFRSWIKPCLTEETKGVPLEVTLKRRAQPIQHVELGALADVLAAERAHGRTAPIVARAVDLWSQRMHADAVRRGTLAGSTMLGYGVVALGIVAFWALVLGSPVVRNGLGHGLGFWTTGIGAWLIALAGYVQNRVSRIAEAV